MLAVRAILKRRHIPVPRLVDGVLQVAEVSDDSTGFRRCEEQSDT